MKTENSYEITFLFQKLSEAIIRTGKPLLIRRVRGARAAPGTPTVQRGLPSLSKKPATFAQQHGEIADSCVNATLSNTSWHKSATFIACKLIHSCLISKLMEERSLPKEVLQNLLHGLWESGHFRYMLLYVRKSGGPYAEGACLGPSQESL